MSSNITLTNAKHVVQSAFTKIDGWIAEMVEYRKSKCPECVQAGRCVKRLPGETKNVGCGCGVPAIMKVPERVDSRGRWPQIADEKAWEMFKLLPDYQEYLDKKIKRENNGPEQVRA